MMDIISTGPVSSRRFGLYSVRRVAVRRPKTRDRKLQRPNEASSIRGIRGETFEPILEAANVKGLAIGEIDEAGFEPRLVPEVDTLRVNAPDVPMLHEEVPQGAIGAYDGPVKVLTTQPGHLMAQNAYSTSAAMGPASGLAPVCSSAAFG
jgi:hypothetical protein